MSTIDLQEDFYFHIKMPSSRQLIIYSVIIGISIFFLGLFIGFDPFALIVFSIIIVILFGIYGYFVYIWWLFVGRISVSLFLEAPLKRLKKRDRKASLFLKLVLGQDLERVFVHLEAPDKDISSPNGLFREMSRIAISFYAFSFFFATILNNNFFYGSSGLSAISQIFYSLLFAMTLSPLFLGIYIPFSLVIEDSRLLLLRRDGSIEYLGTPIRTLLDGVFGLSGLVAGFSLVSKYAQSRFDILIWLIIFGIFMAFYFVFLLPYFLPLMYFYYQQHVGMVNKIRKIALDVEVDPGRPVIEKPDKDEINLLMKGISARFERLPTPSIKRDVLHPLQTPLERPLDQSFTKPQIPDKPDKSSQKYKKFVSQESKEQKDLRKPRKTNFCTNCGYRVKEKQNFCNKCGIRIKRLI